MDNLTLQMDAEQMFKRIRTHFEIEEGMQQLSRREFIKNTAIGGVGIALGGAGILMPNSAQAAEIKIPGAIIEQNKRFKWLANAWYHFHSGKTGDPYISSRTYAADIMGLGPEKVEVQMDRRKAEMESYGYHLLLRQLNEHMDNHLFNNTLKSNNSGLFRYSVGCYYLYHNNDVKAREEFSKGIFSAARLNKQDFERLKKIGIDIEWQGETGNWLANAESLGKKFVWMDLTQKEKVLNIGIGQKKGYDMEGVYWNLGFYAISEVKLGNGGENIKKLLRNENNLYSKLYSQYNFDTASISLYNI